MRCKALGEILRRKRFGSQGWRDLRRPAVDSLRSTGERFRRPLATDMPRALPSRFTLDGKTLRVWAAVFAWSNSTIRRNGRAFLANSCHPSGPAAHFQSKGAGFGAGSDFSEPMERSLCKRERSPATKERSPAAAAASFCQKERSFLENERSSAAKERSPAAEAASFCQRERSSAAKERSFATAEDSFGPRLQESQPRTFSSSLTGPTMATARRTRFRQWQATRWISAGVTPRSLRSVSTGQRMRS